MSLNSVTRPLFVVWDTNDEMNNPLIKEFTDYLMSPEGQYIADSVGYVAIEPMATGYTQVAAQDETPFNLLGLILSLSIFLPLRTNFKELRRLFRLSEFALHLLNRT